MYQIMFYVGLACTFFFLIASVVLFIKNDVRKKIGDLTGTNARKAIQKLNEEMQSNKARMEALSDNNIKINFQVAEEVTETKKSEKKKRFHSRSRNLTKEEATDVLSEDGITDVLNQETTDILSEDKATDILSDREKTDILYGEEATDVLFEDDTTDVLSDQDVTDVLAEEGVTDVLTEEVTDILTEHVTETLASNEETELLYEEIKISEGAFDSILNGATNPDDGIAEAKDPNSIFEIEEDITVVHTEDSI